MVVEMVDLKEDKKDIEKINKDINKSLRIIYFQGFCNGALFGLLLYVIEQELYLLAGIIAVWILGTIPFDKRRLK